MGGALTGIVVPVIAPFCLNKEIRMKKDVYFDNCAETKNCNHYEKVQKRQKRGCCVETNEIMKTYLRALVISLEKKEQVLTNLISITKKQKIALESQPPSVEQFKSEVSKKEELIKEIKELDVQFESLYQKVIGYVRNEISEFTMEIQKMQKMIPIVVELGVTLRGLEQHNKMKLELISATKGHEAVNMKKSSKSVADYYRAIHSLKDNKSCLDQKK